MKLKFPRSQNSHPSPKIPPPLSLYPLLLRSLPATVTEGDPLGIFRTATTNSYLPHVDNKDVFNVPPPHVTKTKEGYTITLPRSEAKMSSPSRTSSTPTNPSQSTSTAETVSTRPSPLHQPAPRRPQLPPILTNPSLSEQFRDPDWEQAPSRSLGSTRLTRHGSTVPKAIPLNRPTGMSATTRQALRQACQAALPPIPIPSPYPLPVRIHTPYPNRITNSPPLEPISPPPPSPSPDHTSTSQDQSKVLSESSTEQRTNLLHPLRPLPPLPTPVQSEHLPLWDGPSLDGQRAFVHMALNPSHYDRIRTEYLRNDADREDWSRIADAVRDRQDLHRLYVGAASRTRLLVEQARQSRVHDLLLQYANDRSQEWFSQQPAGTPTPPPAPSPTPDCRPLTCSHRPRCFGNLPQVLTAEHYAHREAEKAIASLIKEGLLNLHLDPHPPPPPTSKETHRPLQIEIIPSPLTKTHPLRETQTDHPLETGQTYRNSHLLQMRTRKPCPWSRNRTLG